MWPTNKLEELEYSIIHKPSFLNFEFFDKDQDGAETKELVMILKE